MYEILQYLWCTVHKADVCNKAKSLNFHFVGEVVLRVVLVSGTRSFPSKMELQRGLCLGQWFAILYLVQKLLFLTATNVKAGWPV